MNQKIFGRAALVVTALLCCAHGSALSQKTAPGDITVIAGATQVVLTRAEIASLPRHSVLLTSNAGDTSTVSGIALWDVLQTVGAPPVRASGRQRASMIVRLTGADGAVAGVAMVEVDPSFSKRVALLIDQRQGKPLDAVEGPWRVIIPDDIRHARWIRGLVTISVETLQ